MPSEDSDDAEFVVFGTPLAAEETTSRRHDFQKQEVKNASANKSLPVWKQVRAVSFDSSAQTPLKLLFLLLFKHKDAW